MTSGEVFGFRRKMISQCRLPRLRSMEVAMLILLKYRRCLGVFVGGG